MATVKVSSNDGRRVWWLLSARSHPWLPVRWVVVRSWSEAALTPSIPEPEPFTHGIRRLRSRVLLG